MRSDSTANLTRSFYEIVRCFDAVVGAVDLGEVMCDSLGPAEDAAALSFVIHNETIVAERTSYTFTSGSIFEDGAVIA